MKAKEVFDGMLRSGIAPNLKVHGFRRKGHQFGRWVGGVWQVIAFQHSKWSTPEHYEFTINLGVFSRRLVGFYGYKKFPDFPNEWDCHWRQNLDQLTKRGDEHSLIETEADVPDVSRWVGSFIEEHALPALGELASDEALRDHWLDRFDKGSRDLGSMRHLSVLLQRIGPTDRLLAVANAMEDECRGLPCESTVRQHMGKLGLLKGS